MKDRQIGDEGEKIFPGRELEWPEDMAFLSERDYLLMAVQLPDGSIHSTVVEKEDRPKDGIYGNGLYVEKWG